MIRTARVAISIVSIGLMAAAAGEAPELAELRARLAAVEAEEGADALETARVADLLVEALLHLDRQADPETRLLAERVVTIEERALGPSHPDLVASLVRLADTLSAQAMRPEAVSALERALAIIETQESSDPKLLAAILAKLANNLPAAGALERARVVALRLLEIRQAQLGPQARETADAWFRLGNVHLWLYEYDDARRCYAQVVAIHEKRGSPPDTIGRALHQLALATRYTGDFATARSLTERSLGLLEQQKGAEHPDVAMVLDNLGGLMLADGDLVGARRTYERALAIREKAFGPDGNFRLGHSKALLADVASALGDQAEARRLLNRALEILNHTLKPDNADIAAVDHRLADLLERTGDRKSARPYLENALAIETKVYGPQHVVVASSRLQLAELDGNVAESKRSFDALLSSLESQFGPEHPHVAEDLVAFGIWLRDAGEPEAARPLLERGLAIRRSVMGSSHPEVGRTEIELASVLWLLGQREAAVNAALEGDATERAQLDATLRSLPEREALRFASRNGRGIDVALSAVRSPATIERAWDAVIGSRAIVLDEMASRRRDVIDRADPEARRLFDDLTDARRTLATLVARGPEEKQPGRYRADVEAAIRRKESAEVLLAERSKTFREELLRGGIGFREVSQALPDASALVALVRYDRWMQAAKARSPSVASYAAFVLPGRGQAPVLLALGEARRIDALVAEWRGLAGVKPPAAPEARAQAERAYREIGEKLRRAVWDPVAAKLGAAERVFIVPDGQLLRVNFATLPDGLEGFLVEAPAVLHTLDAERDLVAGARSRTRGTGLLAVGSPAFDLAPGPESAGIQPRGRRPSASCEGIALSPFLPLPATKDEVTEIAAIWRSADRADPRDAQAVELTGTAALEGTLKARGPRHRVLHLATHGFFPSERCPSALDGVPGSPLLLSGLALTGFNRRVDAASDDEDGALTAEEIASVDLSGTEWVVLSACETGLGEIRAREGVLGLRRAFHIAGAGTVIMSLWSVQDEATRSWMAELYRERAGGRSTAEAVRNASIDAIDRRRRGGRSTHPFYWGAFIATGEWQ